MEVNFGFDQFKDFDGEILFYYKNEEDQKAKEKTFTSLGLWCKKVLKLTRKEDSGEQKFDDWELARKIQSSKNGKVELKAEEATRLKKLIGENYGPEVVGPAFNLLDSKNSDGTEKKNTKKS